MAKIRNPITFAKAFGVSQNKLKRLGVLNPTLNVDTRLFIDPVLLPHSAVPEMADGATKRVRGHFTNVIKLLDSSTRQGDVAWRAAASLLRFPEIKATCLGYGGATISGTAFGPELSARVLHTADEIIKLGVRDPDLFILIPLLEEGIGPDRISDLTTNVILHDLAALTLRVATDLGVPTSPFPFTSGTYRLPRNPTEQRPTPVLLVPTDVLRTLPVASDWQEVADAAASNATLRARVNNMIGNIWAAKTRRDKARLRRNLLKSKESFEALLDLIHKVGVKPYDLSNDSEGLLIWRELLDTVAEDYPLLLSLTSPLDRQGAIDVVLQIVQQFQDLIEAKGLWRLLWHGSKPHNEKAAQLLFFAVGDAYCKANSLPITPEAETGSGPVDFKFGATYSDSILVEVKLSKNSSLVVGYEKQLDAYSKGTSAVDATYLVIDVGGLGEKYKRLQELSNSRISAGQRPSRLILVDGKRQLSASKRRI